MLACVLERVGADPAGADAILVHAGRLGVDPLEVAATRLGVGLAAIYEAAAVPLGFAFSEHISDLVGPADFAPVALSDFAELRSLRGQIGGQEVLFAAPDLVTLLALAQTIAPEDPLRGQMCIVPPDALTRAITRHCAPRLLAQARERPGAAFPGPGARIGINSPAAAVLLVMLGICLFLGLAAPLGLHPVPAALLSLILLAPSAFRLWAALIADKALPLVPRALLPDAALPIYSVLVPLRDEAHMVDQMVGGLKALDYPPEKLDIKFIVESTSPETVAAAARHTGDSRFSLIVVPRGGPATKPKALNYALPLVRGSLIVIFDAEDLPEPGQLRRAASLFAEREDISCLQAALTVDNADKSWFTRMFAAEYAGHFEVLLPAIGHARLPMPLGGSSNHLRTQDLLAVGGWDPYNVTEDADLGLRLARAGKGCAVFDSHTFEEAPPDWRGWHRQRSRWMKGWMQTLVVHNHRPAELFRALGAGHAFAVNVFIGSMVVSTALHGVFLVTLIASILARLAFSGSVALSSLLYLVLLLLGYAGAAAAGVIGLQRTGRSDLAPWLLSLPAYWLMGGLAAAAATWGLVVRPFYWAKTEHAGSGNAARPHERPHAISARRPIDASAPGE